MQAGRGEKRSLPLACPYIHSNNFIIFLPKCCNLNSGYSRTWNSDLHLASTAPVLLQQRTISIRVSSKLLPAWTRSYSASSSPAGLFLKSRSTTASGPGTFSTIPAGRVKGFPIERPWTVTGIGGSSAGCWVGYNSLAGGVAKTVGQTVVWILRRQFRQQISVVYVS